jgi:hypothetical protein
MVQLQVSIEPDTIKIGERAEINIDITKNKQVILQPFVLVDSLNKEIEILDSLKTSSQDLFSLKLQVTSFTTGSYTIPRIPLIFNFENTIDTIYSSEITLVVVSPEIVNTNEIRDIKPPLNLPFKLVEIIPETGLVTGILLIFIIIFLIIIRRFRKNKQLVEIEKKLPPHIFAFRELEKLKEEKLWQNGKMKEYYSR